MTALPTLDIHSRDFLEFPNRVLGRDGRRLAVARGTSGPEFFTYEAVSALFRDPRVRPKTAEVYLDMGLSRDSPIYAFLQHGNFNMMPVPDHDRLRPIVMKGFRPARIKEAGAMIGRLAETLAAPLRERPRSDIVADFSHHLSIRSIAGFIGVPPEDVHEFESATVELILLGTVPFMPGVPRLEAALNRIFAYIEGLVAKRRTAPREDVVSDLVAAQADDQLSEAELIWCIVFLLLAGHDTTRYQIASTVRGILEAGLWEEIAADPALIPAAVKEAHRMYPASYRFPRVVLEPFEAGGQAFAPGDLLSLNLAAAGRDPERFAEPDRFDPWRGGPGFEIGFGFGGHHCIGWALATAELTQAIQTLTRQLTDVAIEEIEYKVGGVIAGPERLVVRHRPRG
jgi:cytochrome P450